LSTGLAGLEVWKQKSSLSVAPSGGKFYEFMLSEFHALGTYLFLLPGIFFLIQWCAIFPLPLVTITKFQVYTFTGLPKLREPTSSTTTRPVSWIGFIFLGLYYASLVISFFTLFALWSFEYPLPLERFHCCTYLWYVGCQDHVNQTIQKCAWFCRTAATISWMVPMQFFVLEWCPFP
jgi:hypothetical protein